MKRKNRILIITALILNLILISTYLFSGPKEDYEKGLREELKKIFDNPEEIEQFIEHAENFKPTIKREDYAESIIKGPGHGQPIYFPNDMIIITNEELEQDFLEFAGIKNREGIKTKVVTTYEIGDTPEEIREYLKTRKQRNPSLKFVLIGGDASVVMPKMIWNPYYHQWAESCIEGYGSEFPTDYYFCNVLSDWISDDEINFEADLYVGRIPADTQEEVQNFINKYESYRYSGNFSGNYHLIANNLMKRPGSIIGNYIIDVIGEHINTHIDYTYEEDLYYAEPGDTIRPCVLFGWALARDDFSFLFNVAHGHRECIGAYNIMCNAAAFGDSCTGHPPGTYIMGIPPFENTNILTINDTICQVGNLPWHAPEYYEYLPPYLSNTNPYLFWSSACRSTLFAMIDTNYTYFPAECVGAEFINNPNGAVAYYASSFLEYPFTTRHSVEDFMDYIFSDEFYEIGEIFIESHQLLYSRADNNAVRDLILSHILFGDPSMQIWSEKAKNFNVYRLESQDKFGSFLVLDEGLKPPMPVSNVRCNLISESDNIFLRGFTDEDGVVEFEIGEQDISEMELTAIKANFIPYSEVVEEIHYYAEKEFLVYRLESPEEYADFLVLDINKEPIDDVRCELMKGDELFMREFTNRYGIVEFFIRDNDISKMEFRANKIGFVQYSEIVERIPYYGKGDEDMDSELDISLLCYPNPVQGSTSICFSTTEIPEDAEIKIYNVKGQLVKNFGDLTGKEKVVWSGQDNRDRQLSNGIYFYRIETDKYKSEIRKILMLR